MAAKGIAYFNDGHTEAITDFKKYGMHGLVEFYTHSGRYFYEEEVHEVNGNYLAIRQEFYKINPYAQESKIAAPIHRIVLL